MKIFANFLGLLIREKGAKVGKFETVSNCLHFTESVKPRSSSSKIRSEAFQGYNGVNLLARRSSSGLICLNTDSLIKL